MTANKDTRTKPHHGLAAVVGLSCVLAACGYPDPYYVEGMAVTLTAAGSPSPACMVEAVAWMRSRYGCSPSPGEFPATVNSLHWRSEPWRATYTDGRGDQVCGTVAGLSRQYVGVGWVLWVAWRDGVTSSALVHEWHHVSLEFSTGDSDPGHWDASWHCVETLQQDAGLDACVGE